MYTTELGPFMKSSYMKLILGGLVMDLREKATLDQIIGIGQTLNIKGILLETFVREEEEREK